MKSDIRRIVPVGFTLFPIGIFFGVLAAQANWSAIEVFLMSVIGFTGSGQFAFLGFANQGLENINLLSVFLIILSMNLRYVPMSLSASQPLRASFFNKLLLAHWLADESYASEHVNDTIRSRMVIRFTILIFWVLSTSLGVILATLLPTSFREELNGVTFPVSAILIALSFANIENFVQQTVRKTHYLKCILLCIGIIIFLQALLGMVYFWLPSIGICYYLLIRFGK